MSWGRRAAVRRAGDGDQQLVARPVAHRVVDELEVVEVDEEDAHDPRPSSAGECPLDPVPEQHPVREPGERVVERPVGELVLQLPLLGDVAHGQHDPADGRDRRRRSRRRTSTSTRAPSVRTIR